MHEFCVKLDAQELDTIAICSFEIFFKETKIGGKGAEEFWVWIVDKKEIVKIVNKLSMKYMFEDPMKTFCK